MTQYVRTPKATTTAKLTRVLSVVAAAKIILNSAGELSEKGISSK